MDHLAVAAVRNLFMEIISISCVVTPYKKLTPQEFQQQLNFEFCQVRL